MITMNFPADQAYDHIADDAMRLVCQQGERNQLIMAHVGRLMLLEVVRDHLRRDAANLDVQFDVLVDRTTAADKMAQEVYKPDRFLAHFRRFWLA